MTHVPIDFPETLGFDSVRLARVRDLLRRWTDSDTLPAAALCVGRRGSAIEPLFLGRQRLRDETPLRPDAVFLVASITKPLVVTAAMVLVERGELGLDDPVAEFLPEFTGHDKGEVRLRHLMTHTSGLPDMLPNNAALRAAHSPMSRFVEETCRHPLLFPPGTRVRYQSMGTLLLAEIVGRVSGQPIARFLEREIFQPLGMSDTSLGLRPATRDRLAELRVPPEQEGTDWNWNSDYWLSFGAPWGGLITTPMDLARFALVWLGEGTWRGIRLLSPAAVRAMTRNQLNELPLVPEEDRRCQPWGLGWRLGWPGKSAHFGDLVGPRTYGHWGATGTALWIDPDADAFCVILTTTPQEGEGRYLARVSNAVAAAWI
jgi:CubicO group peptidase (beta-lactamase class C family)